MTPTQRAAMELKVDDLAQEIRRIDGSHRMGAGALAEALMPFVCKFTAEPAPVQETVDGDIRSDAMADLSYLNGLKAGWNFCVANDDTGYAAAVYARSDALHALKTAPVQEPVKVGCLRCNTPKKCDIWGCSPNTFPSEQPVPPADVPILSEKEMLDFACHNLKRMTDGVLFNYARSIEALARQKAGQK